MSRNGVRNTYVFPAGFGVLGWTCVADLLSCQGTRTKSLFEMACVSATFPNGLMGGGGERAAERRERGIVPVGQ